MRLPRSAPRCSRIGTPRPRNQAWPCVTCSSTGPQRAARAACTAASTSVRCSLAAAASPMRCAMRVFTLPASGARAKTMTTQSALIGVIAREALRRGAEGIEEPQPPHQEDGAQHATGFPAASGGRYARSQACGRAAALEQAAERDVLHERDVGKAREGIAAHEDRLVAGGDAREPRAQVHGATDEREQRPAAGDAHAEAAPAGAR